MRYGVRSSPMRGLEDLETRGQTNNWSQTRHKSEPARNWQYTRTETNDSRAARRSSASSENESKKQRRRRGNRRNEQKTKEADTTGLLEWRAWKCGALVYTQKHKMPEGPKTPYETPDTKSNSGQQHCKQTRLKQSANYRQRGRVVNVTLRRPSNQKALSENNTGTRMGCDHRTKPRRRD